MTEQNGANFLVSLKNNAEYDKKKTMGCQGFIHALGRGRASISS